VRSSGARGAAVRYGRPIKRAVVLSLVVALGLVPAVADAHTLTRARAKAAAQARANDIADRRTRITKLFSTRAPAGGHGTHAYTAEARWRSRSGEPCFAELRVRFASGGSGRVIVRLLDMSC
jgi:hypothetical protein